MAKAKTRRSPGDGSLYKRKSDGMWIGAVTLPPGPDGKRRKKTVSARDRNECMEKKRQLELSIAEGIVSDKPNLTMAAWLDYWLKEIRGPVVRQKTYDYYEGTIRLYLKPLLGHRRLNQLTAAHVRDMLASIEDTAKRKRAYVVLRLALKSAVADRRIRYNVTDSIATPDHVADSRGAFDFQTARQIITFALNNRGPAEATRWAMAFLTGARQGEVLGLRWQYVNLEEGTVELAWQLAQLEQEHGCEKDADGKPTCGRKFRCPQRTYKVPKGGLHLVESLGLTSPKTKAGFRIVPLIPPLAEAFKQLREVVPDNEFDLVWATPAGKPIHPRDDHDAWRQLLKDAGVPYMPLHAARHTTATLLQRFGVDEDTRMKITGHSSAAAHRGYVHVSTVQTREALDKLRELMP